MTLQVSGAISLDNIQTEFGGANPISLSEYYAGGGLVASGTAGIPTSGLISLNSFYGAASKIPAWILDLGVQRLEKGVSLGGGNIAIAGRFKNYNFNGGTLGGIATINSLGVGTITYFYNINGICYSVDVDSSGNKYIANNNGQIAVLIKINSSNVVQWRVGLSGATVFSDNGGMHVKVGSDGVYLLSSNYASGSAINFAKFSFAGSVLWSKNIVAAGSEIAMLTSGSSISTNSTRFIFSAATKGSSAVGSIILGNPATGAILNQRLIGRGTVTDSAGAGGIVVASDNTFFAPIILSRSSSGSLHFPKLDSSGSITALTEVLTGYGPASIGGTAIDSSNNVYVSLLSPQFSGGASRILILKFNSAAVLQWQRTFYHSTQSFQDARILVDNAGSFILTTTGSISMVIKLPVDGTMTGTYNDNRSGLAGTTFTYAASTFTSQNIGSYSAAGNSLNTTATNTTALAAAVTMDIYTGEEIRLATINNLN